MQRFILILIPFFLQCGHSKNNNPSDETRSTITHDTNISNNYPKNTSSISSKSWADTLISNYIAKTDNVLIRATPKDTILEEWLFDHKLSTDTAKYFIFQVGHDVSDSGGDNKRFVTDVWLYLDSNTGKLYEYNVSNDSLYLWTK